MMRTLLPLLAAALLAACGATPDKPVRATLYDFGPGPTAPAPAGSQPPVVLADIDSSGALDGSAMNYRLAYADGNQLRPYATARWAASPPQLIRQRLREQIGRERPVLDLTESAALARTGGTMPRVLRVELQEFSHVFESEKSSFGLLRLRATLMENTPAGERLVSQRQIVQRVAAPSPDAPGGVRALTAATDQAAAEIGQWLRDQR